MSILAYMTSMEYEYKLSKDVELELKGCYITSYALLN